MKERLVSCVFALLGVGVLVPWNAFISARPYFEARMCGEGTFFTRNIELWFSILYNVASVLSLAILLGVQYAFQARITRPSPLMGLSLSIRSNTTNKESIRPSKSNGYSMETEETSTWYMTMISLALYLVVFMFTTTAVMIPGISAPVFMVWTLLGLFVCGICTSIASAGIIGTAGMFDTEIGVGPYFQGQAAGGILVTIANVMATVWQDPNKFHQAICEKEKSDLSSVVPHACIPYATISWSTLAYFALGTLSIVACMAGYAWIKKTQSLREGYVSIDASVIDVPSLECQAQSKDEGTPQTTPCDSFGYEDDCSGLSVPGFGRDVELDSNSEENDSIYSVWTKTKWLALSLFTTYVLTLAVFPVITSDLTSAHQCQTNSRLSNDLFVPLTFLVFNIGDLAGRFTVTDSTTDKFQGRDRMLFWASVGRWAFVPLFLLCYSQKSLYQNIAIQSDLFSWAVQFFFAFTNGMLTSLCFSHAPSLISSREETQQISSAILNLSLCSGLLIGSFLSFPLLWAFSGIW